MGIRIAAAVCICLCLEATSSYAWGEKGHRIVALIAQDKLTPAAKAAVADLLSVETDIRVHSFEDGAVWPDLIKFARPETKPWHFVDIQKALTNYDAMRDCTEAGPTNCIIPRIEGFVLVLKDKTKPLPDRLEALKFIEHLIGDLHQPLHCSDNMDRGGNDLAVKWFGKKTISIPCGIRRSWTRPASHRTCSRRTC